MNKEQKKEYNRRHYQKHKDRLLNNQKEYYKNNKENYRKYYIENKDKIKEYQYKKFVEQFKS